MKISACYIVRNEEKNLRHSLVSLGNNVDELVVVDTGSEDTTKEIAQEFHACVYDFPWQDDFSKARNFALDKAGGDWIIFLDADEYFVNSEGLSTYLRKADTYPSCEGILLPLININIDTGKDNAEFIDRTRSLRIWRNEHNFRFVGSVHEMLYVHEKKGMRSLKMIEAHEKFTLHHTGYSTVGLRQKYERYLSMLQKEIRENGEQLLSARYLADCYFGLEDYERAAYYASRAISREQEMGITTVAGFYKLYRYWLEAGKKLGYPRDKMASIGKQAILDTRKESNNLNMQQFVETLLAKMGG